MNKRTREKLLRFKPQMLSVFNTGRVIRDVSLHLTGLSLIAFMIAINAQGHYGWAVYATTITSASLCMSIAFALVGLSMGAIHNQFTDQSLIYLAEMTGYDGFLERVDSLPDSLLTSFEKYKMNELTKKGLSNLSPDDIRSVALIVSKFQSVIEKDVREETTDTLGQARIALMQNKASTLELL